jgi:sugar phosphate permease
MDLELTTMRKVTLRIMPILIICYVAAYLDRVNVGFAALQMNKAIGLTSSAFGFGAWLFFLTYFIFEVPANLAMHRFGARRWIARIMISWGLVAGATAFVQGPTSFYTARGWSRISWRPCQSAAQSVHPYRECCSPLRGLG